MLAHLFFGMQHEADVVARASADCALDAEKAHILDDRGLRMEIANPWSTQHRAVRGIAIIADDTKNTIARILGELGEPVVRGGGITIEREHLPQRECPPRPEGSGLLPQLLRDGEQHATQLIRRNPALREIGSAGNGQHRRSLRGRHEADHVIATVHNDINWCNGSYQLLGQFEGLNPPIREEKDSQWTAHGCTSLIEPYSWYFSKDCSLFPSASGEPTPAYLCGSRHPLSPGSLSCRQQCNAQATRQLLARRRRRWAVPSRR